MSKIKAVNHESYNSYSIIGFLMPMVGFILGIVYLAKDKEIDRKLGEHLVVVSFLGGFFWGIAWVFYLNGMVAL